MAYFLAVNLQPVLSHVQLFAMAWTAGYPPAPGSCHSPGKNTGVSCHALFPPGDLPNPRIKPRSPTLEADSLQSEPPGKPKNTGVGSLVRLQLIFPIPESNWDLPHCRWIFLPAELPGRPIMYSPECNV